jgi:hypothetical protein
MYRVIKVNAYVQKLSLGSEGAINEAFFKSERSNGIFGPIVDSLSKKRNIQ